MTHDNQAMGASPEELAYYNRTVGEVARYRDYQWKIPMWTLGFLLGCITLNAARPPGEVWLRVGMLAAVIAWTWFACRRLYECHDALTKNRKVLRAIETRFPKMNALVGTVPEWLKEQSDITWWKWGGPKVVGFWLAMGAAAVFAVAHIGRRLVMAMLP